MISLILIKLGHSMWCKHKINKVLKFREKAMIENFKKKRISFYSKFKRQRALATKKNKKKRVSLYNKRRNTCKIK